MSAIEEGGKASGEAGLGRLWIGLLLGMAVGLACCAMLPFSPYIAWQQSAGTQMFHSRWIFERLHHDPTPIDVALIGSSKIEAGISPTVMEEALEAKLGYRPHVANLAIVMPGRDFADKIMEELLATHPEVRLVVLSNDGDVTNSHPMFRQTARLGELLEAPLLVNLQYGTNLLAWPYRAIANFAQQRRPQWFGVASAFAPSHYEGCALDRTLGYRLASGEMVNGDQSRSKAQLLAMSRAAIGRQKAGLAMLAFLPDEARLAIDRHYVASMATRARRARVDIVFLSLPFFGPLQPVGALDAYRQWGTNIALPALASEPSFYQSAAHLNRRGAIVASRLSGEAISPYLGRNDRGGLGPAWPGQGDGRPGRRQAWPRQSDHNGPSDHDGQSDHNGRPGWRECDDLVAR
ncbi:hypothetical protein [Sphingobium yanoikuyae]|uniref:Uncharacterized protein n=1 Tax=Sphingobium yanoikuyae TaxID=13690 RepID=A0A3G2URN7_SPHYA|nr:hypothetical protein [Sphingobium yanoikuyae]AYO77204.1 hypothetical protein EBF16_10040 [Sphingobium yanoikuyae]